MKSTRKKTVSAARKSATKKVAIVKKSKASPSRVATVAPSRVVKMKKDEPAFREIVGLIEQARDRAYQAVNTTLIDLYWQVGEYISRKLETAAWGEGVVEQLAVYISRRHPDIKGFARPNLFRMRQFYETYCKDKKVSPLVRQLPWTHNILILMRCKRPEEREFYLRLAIRERWGKRDLERQLKGALFERTILAPPKVSPLVRQLVPVVENVFKDTYLLDFLDLPEVHSEADLQSALVGRLKQFILELGRDFCFVGEQYLLQVGGKDYRIDLVFFHRELQCLVAIELKIDEFQPEYLGKLEFELEALDRNVRKDHERESIGVLLCASKDNEVVEYALSRAASPTLIADYQTRLPPKQLLKRKLHEFYRLALPEPVDKKTALPRAKAGKSKPRG